MPKENNNVLIKLRRQYSKDEVVIYLINLIKNLKVEVGKLICYNQELKHREHLINLKIKNLNKEINKNYEVKCRILKENLKKSNLEKEHLKKLIKNLRDEKNTTIKY
jgi:hypothetical protein